MFSKVSRNTVLVNSVGGYIGIRFLAAMLNYFGCHTIIHRKGLGNEKFVKYVMEFKNITREKPILDTLPKPVNLKIPLDLPLVPPSLSGLDKNIPSRV